MSRKKADRVEVTGSVFEALGFTPEEAAVYAMEVDLAMAIEEWRTSHGHSQRKAATILKVPVSKMSNVVNKKFEQTSLDYLVKMAAKAGLRPKLKFSKSVSAKPSPKQQAGRRTAARAA